MYLNHQTFALRGIKMSIIEEGWVDTKFVDNTTLYMESN